MTPAEPPPLRIDKYTVTGEIGSGGFGHVYGALDPTVGRVVAIKVLSAPGDTGIVKRFRSEAKTVANLHHRNIVTVYEFGEESGVPYLVMEPPCAPGPKRKKRRRSGPGVSPWGPRK